MGADIRNPRTRLRPSALGFARRYILALTPIAAYALSLWTSSLVRAQLPWLQLSPEPLAVLFTAVLFLASWVLRSPEPAAACLLSLTLPLALALLKSVPLQEIPSAYTASFPASVAAASLAVLLGVELKRRSVSYEVADAGVTIKAGIWRRQEQTILYQSIGRIVLEQSILGRLLNYGTIVIVSPAEWGAEYYTRGVEAALSGGRASAGAFYARTLKEVSREPSKCLYGVKNPGEVRKLIESKLREIHHAEAERAQLRKKLEKGTPREDGSPGRLSPV